MFRVNSKSSDKREITAEKSVELGITTEDSRWAVDEQKVA